MKEKIDGRKTSITFIIILIVCAIMIAFHPVQAKAIRTGTYSKTWKAPSSAYNPTGINPTYSVVINRISKKSIRFQVDFTGMNGNYVYSTKVINAGIKNNKVTFKWKDSWTNHGKGVLKLYGSYVKIKMTVTKQAKLNRNTLETRGHYAGKDGYLKLKRTSSQRKVDNW